VKVVQALLSAAHSLSPEAARLHAGVLCGLDAAWKQGVCGKQPLHYVIEHKAPMEVVQAVMAAWPEAVREKDMDDWSPLHFACIKNAPIEVLLAVFTTWPEAISELDMRGRRPGYYCVTLEVLLGLVLEDLPFRMETRMQAEEGGKSTSAPAVVGRPHFFTWHWLLDASVDKGKAADFVLSVVESVLLLHPHMAPQLAVSKDKQGREAISTASSEVRRLLHSYILFCGRYELQAGPAAHKSGTAVVFFATDKHQPDAAAVSKVALKFMANLDQFEREQVVRSSAGFDERLVLSVLRGHTSTADEQYAASAHRMGLSAYPYCLVMPAADRSLADIIAHDHIAGWDWPAVKAIAEQLVRAVGDVHGKGLVHGDLKPLNIMRVGAQIKLIDLDAAAS